jgi:hypothetical protein
VRRASFSWVLILASLSLLGGCEVMRPNAGRMFAIESAGYAGRFRLAYDRWPALSELEEFMCMNGRADRFGLALLSCRDVVFAPLRTSLLPVGRDLHMEFFDKQQQRVCRLRVRAPTAEAQRSAFPKIVIETTVFACRGGDAYWGEADL